LSEGRGVSRSLNLKGSQNTLVRKLEKGLFILYKGGWISYLVRRS